jgi:hypothetical protein
MVWFRPGIWKFRVWQKQKRVKSPLCKEEDSEIHIALKYKEVQGGGKSF